MRKLAVFLCFGLSAVPLGAYAQDLPPGPGADVTQRVCSACHGLDTVTGEHHDAAGWSGVVNDMIGNGAVATDQEQAQIVNYLTTNFGIPGAAPAAPAAAAAAPAPGTPATPTPDSSAAPGTPATPTPDASTTPAPPPASDPAPAPGGM